MDKLWAPWRINYIKSKKQKKCIFCQARNNGKKSYRLLKTRYSIAVLNLFPYNNGHILVSPLRHVGKIEQLKDEEIVDMFKVINSLQRKLQSALNPDGFNIGINLGKAAGAGITAHLHIHIVPRWIGDTNFIPVLYNTKVISQSLDELFRKLKKC